MCSARARRRVLVTDDDPLLRWALCARLEELGLEVIEAASVRRTLEREGEADLVLLDVRLPDGDGLQAAREMLSRRPQRPLLLMTAFATPELAAEAARAGVRHCLEKPFDMDVVARIVDDTLQD
jgi:two-component system, NtrC family, response regulator AtoC